MVIPEYAQIAVTMLGDHVLNLWHMGPHRSLQQAESELMLVCSPSDLQLIVIAILQNHSQLSKDEPGGAFVIPAVQKYKITKVSAVLSVVNTEYPLKMRYENVENATPLTYGTMIVIELP